MNYWGEEKEQVVGIGSVLVDILMNESDDFVEAVGGAKGGMVYVPMEHLVDVVTRASAPPVFVPGGSACNAIIGVGRLGGKARFIGKSGGGEMAAFFTERLERSGVAASLLKSSSKTGRVVSIITPDAQRSMLTCLGASAEMAAAEITQALFDGAAIVHVEGYLVFNRDLITAVMKSAKAAGARISLDLASFTVVKETGDFLRDLVTEYVDILMANEDEAEAFTGLSDEDAALRAMAEKSELAVLKVGSRGSFIMHGGEMVRVAVEGDGTAKDTTGAGDLWAAGFLYGLVSGMSLAESGRLGSLCGYEVCQVVGAAIPDEGWERIKAAMERNA